MLPALLPILKVAIPAVSSLFGGMLAGKSAKKNAQQQAGGATLAQLMPQIQALMAQQQQISQRNYGNQLQQFRTNQPLQDAVRQMAMRMLPPR
jgi:hypothetical protein